MSRVLSYFVLVYAVWRLLSEMFILFLASIQAAPPAILIYVVVLSIAAAKMGDKAADWIANPLTSLERALLSLYASLAATAIAILFVYLRGLADPDAAVYFNNLFAVGQNRPWVYLASILVQAFLIRIVFGFFYTATLKDLSED